ncbi:MAG: endonuclease [Candidatus Cloacimonetes bacterium]|nr:endonuclease [Candidatus Cloacimonadota bacterium]
MPYSEGFDNLNNVNTYSVSGNQIWETANFGNPSPCAKMSGFSGSIQINEDWLITPSLNFSGLTNITMEFEEAINYENSVLANQQILLSTDYSGSGDPNNAGWTELTVSGRSSGDSWDFVSVVPLDLTNYSGESSVYIGFRYTSTSEVAGTWEIDNVNIYEGTSYYSSVSGLTGNALWQGLQSIISTNHASNSESGAKSAVYTQLDNYEGMVQCIYSGVWEAPGSSPNYTPAGFSIEHSYPQSWYNQSGDNISEQNKADWDLHHLFPSEATANSERSNKPLDYITNVSLAIGNGDYYSYSGNNASSSFAFEVADGKKGNIARALLYFTIRYYDDNNGLTRAEVNMLPVMYQWHYQDPVDEYEIARNNAVFAIQGNRNPFIDYPEFVEDLWGNLILDTPLNPVASSIAETSFVASWDAPERSIGYRLDVSTDSNFLSYNGFVEGFKNRFISGNSQAVTGLVTGNTYYFRVKAVESSDGKLSLYSSNGYATTGIVTEGYSVNFEGIDELKASYSSDTVNLSGLNWDMTEALIGTDANDWKNGIRSARLRGYGTSSMTMLQNKANGIGTVSFNYRRYGTDNQVDWKIEYSTDNAVTWIQIGNTFAAPSTDEVQTFYANINVDESIRVRIKQAAETGGSNNRLNIDDILITDYDPNLLSSPQNIDISISASTVTIFWDAVTGASSYRVEESSSPNGTFSTAIGVFNGTEWTGTVNGDRRFYRVIAE